MVNPVKGEVPLSLSDGRQFVLVLDHEALIEAEALYRKPLAHLMADATLAFAGACRALLYGALRAHHAEVTPREAAAIFLENSSEVSRALAEAAEAAFPKVAEGRQSENPPQPGTSSGRSGAKPAKKPKRSSGQRRAPTN